MMKAALLESAEQAEALRGARWREDSHCNPVVDGLGRWVISIEEMNGLGLTLDVVEWVAPVIDEELK